MRGLRTEHGIEVPAAPSKNESGRRLMAAEDDPDSERNPVQPARMLQFPRSTYFSVLL